MLEINSNFGGKKLLLPKLFSFKYTKSLIMKRTFILIIAIILTACNCNKPVNSKAETLYNYNVEEKINDLGIELETPSKPVANYVGAVKTGNLVFLSGKISKDANGKLITGKLGSELSVEEGYEAARFCGIDQLSTLKAEIGDLNKVVRIVKVTGMVNSDPNFTDQSKVVNGFSDLMVEIFGERGKHARAAVGMASLPLGVACEIEMIVEVQK
jgi:enamine deaminase RidA (YjgF/YER057c/UK114 family)